MGLALGVFIGVTPTIPFHTALIIVFGTMFRQNITAAYLGSWLISNPVTIPIFYLLQYELGIAVLGWQGCEWTLTECTVQALAGLGTHIMFPLFIGGALMAPLFAAPSYFIAHRFLLRLRRVES